MSGADVKARLVEALGWMTRDGGGPYTDLLAALSDCVVLTAEEATLVKEALSIGPLGSPNEQARLLAVARLLTPEPVDEP